MRVFVPTINDDTNDFERLFDLWRQLDRDGLDVTLDFSQCSFLRQNGVAFLGGLIRLIQQRQGAVCVNWNDMPNAVRANREQNGFHASFSGRSKPWTGNAIPFREDIHSDRIALMNYLKSHWLGRGWVNVSDKLRSVIVGIVWKIYANAFEHGESPVGVFSCGQHFPKCRDLVLTVVDFGAGIPATVRGFFSLPKIPAGPTMSWAFQPNTTTRPGAMGRGTGLDVLKQFVRLNRGCLEVFSHDGHARISQSGEFYRTRPIAFKGTLVNLKLVCDDTYYHLATELADEEPLF